jgi:hypothetical protein
MKKMVKQLHWAYEISLREISLHIEPFEDQLSYTNEKDTNDGFLSRDL